MVSLFVMSVSMVLAQDACEGNFDYDKDVDGGDAALFKSDFGRVESKSLVPQKVQHQYQKQDKQLCMGHAMMAIGEQAVGVEWPNPRFTDNGDGTVTDNLTALIWLKNANCFGVEKWNDALSSAMDWSWRCGPLMVPVLVIGGFPIDLNWKVYWI